MNRICSYPPGHWRMRVDIPYSMGVRQGRLFFLCEQADLTGQGVVQNPGDLEKQTRAVMAHIRTIVEDLDCAVADIAKLVVYYVNDGGGAAEDWVQSARVRGITILHQALWRRICRWIGYIPMEPVFKPTAGSC